MLLDAPANSGSSAVEQRCATVARTLIQSGKLNDLGGRPLTLFTSTDFGAEVLFFTPHRIIASNYHRDGAAIRFVWEAAKIADEDELRRHLAERNVEALLLCPEGDTPKTSVLSKLQQGLTPPWLTRVAYPKPPMDSEALPGSDPALFLVSGAYAQQK